MVNDLLTIETVVEIDDNERYWVGGGFGSKGLLPNDRGPFTTTDGSMSWKSTEEASKDLLLLGRGWKYEGEEFTRATDWMYAKDFRVESIEHAKPDRGMMHFVRFRRLYRTKVFNPDEFIPRSVSEKCNQGDSSATDNVGQLLLDTLTYCTLLHNPSSYTDAVALLLKERIINIAMHEYDDENNNTSAFHLLDQLRIKLEHFIKNEAAKTVMNRLITHVDFKFDNRGDKEVFIIRKKVVCKRCLPHKECEALSSLVVKNLDPHFQLHCDQLNCGENCRFFRVQCPNEGCTKTLSKMYLPEHDMVCPYKIVQCECGDSFPRHQQEVHNKEACKLREVDCPFRNIGCMLRVRACDLQSHLDEHSSRHLILSVKRLMEHESVIRNLNAKIMKLENENTEMKKILDDHIKKSNKNISHLDAKVNKTSKNLINYEAKSKKELLRLSNMIKN